MKVDYDIIIANKKTNRRRIIKLTGEICFARLQAVNKKAEKLMNTQTETVVGVRYWPRYPDIDNWSDACVFKMLQECFPSLKDQFTLSHILRQGLYISGKEPGGYINAAFSAMRIACECPAKMAAIIHLYELEASPQAAFILSSALGRVENQILYNAYFEHQHDFVDFLGSAKVFKNIEENKKEFGIYNEDFDFFNKTALVVGNKPIKLPKEIDPYCSYNTPITFLQTKALIKAVEDENTTT